LTIDLPITSGHGKMVGDAEPTAALTSSVDDDVFVIAHRYGGVVATQAAAQTPRFRGVIDTAALKPALGSSAVDTTRRVVTRTQLDYAIIRADDQSPLEPVGATRT